MSRSNLPLNPRTKKLIITLLLPPRGENAVADHVRIHVETQRLASWTIMMVRCCAIAGFPSAALPIFFFKKLRLFSLETDCLWIRCADPCEQQRKAAQPVFQARRTLRRQARRRSPRRPRFEQTVQQREQQIYTTDFTPLFPHELVFARPPIPSRFSLAIRDP